MVSNKIVDCFIFYNELDLLEYRLNVLWDIVSFFVICEASTTFIGNSKEYYLENSRFDSYRSKIIQLKIDLPYPTPDISKNEQWLNELTQRNFLYNGVNYLYEKNKISDNDLIIINDVDEIPDPNTLILLTKQKSMSAFFILIQKYHCYNLEIIRVHDWYHVKILSYHTLTKLLKNTPFSTIRMYSVTISLPQDIYQLTPIHIINGGWHLSYFGDTKFIQNKIDNFSHQEINITEEEIKERMDKGIDISGNNSVLYNNVKIKDNNYLPPNICLLSSLFNFI